MPVCLNAGIRQRFGALLFEPSVGTSFIRVTRRGFAESGAGALNLSYESSAQLLSTWMYFLTYNYNTVGRGTAIAVVLFSLTLIFAIPYLRVMTRKNT
jgi:ABC-type sugar transport system permease subunit